MARIWPLRGSSTTVEPAGAANAGPPHDWVKLSNGQRVRASRRPCCSVCSAYCWSWRSIERTMSLPGTGSRRLDLPDDPVAGVDLVGDRARLAPELVLVLLLDAGLAHPLVQLVALAPVGLGALGGDGAHVADDVAGQRGVAVDPLPALAHLDPGVVLPPLTQVDGGRLRHVVGQRQRQVRVVLDVGVAGLQVLDRGLQRPRQAGEEDLALGRAADLRPVDRHREHPPVVGHDHPVAVEDATAHRGQLHRADAGGLHLLVQPLRRHHLQVPEPGEEGGEEGDGHDPEHPEPQPSSVPGHNLPILPPARASPAVA